MWNEALIYIILLIIYYIYASAGLTIEALQYPQV